MRARPKILLKSLLTLVAVVFIVINMILMRPSDNIPDQLHVEDAAKSISETGKEKVVGSTSYQVVSTHSTGIAHEKTYISLKEKTISETGALVNKGKALHVPRAKVDANNLAAVKSAMLDVNIEQKVHNLKKFKFNQNKDGVIILIQTHNRPEYLRHMVMSLKNARDIDKSLLIFSHDYYSEELNDIVFSVDFCPVMQIFYPYSIQVYPKEFPGDSPNDCPRNIGRVRAKQMKCNNSDHPDKYGHYREAKYAQTKHHWFWKIHRVFDELPLVKNFEGFVLLLEEDHYVSPDFIHVLQLMMKQRKNVCKDCNVLTLGNYDKIPIFTTVSSSVFINPWISSKHNLGMAVDRKLWNKIKACSEKFCKFDDYNWDWTLQYISATCIPGKMKALVAKSPRVFHIGECGVHHKGKNCDPKIKVSQINNILERNKQHLFPNGVNVINQRQFVQRTPKPNGGWGDVRDHELCHSFINDLKQR